MNRIDVAQPLWAHLKRLPRWVWISGGVALLLIPALLLWALLAMVGGAWQAGGAMLGQQRAALQTMLPEEVQRLARELPMAGALQTLQTEAQQRAQAELDRLKSAIPSSAEALQQGLAGATLPVAAENLRQLSEQGRATADQALSTLLGGKRPASDVSGEDPPGVVRLPGFVRTGFVRDGDSLKVSWSGSAPHAEVVAFYTQQLSAAGYRAQVLQAGGSGEVVSFESSQRRLTLSARDDGRSGSEIEWQVH
ncbi:MAG: hypothetical protein H0U74_01455 [Bradymonadaceae bacterium]|nr:hypothetical protein [Lujinxingiaceae bacterium]